jgi:glutathione S-transferase
VTLRLFTFGPGWGLPTAGPFGLKLEACLRTLGVAYERHLENDTRKGPKRKSPWIEDGEAVLGDTELILAHVERSTGRALDRDLSNADRARSLALRRMLEEHYHQVFEYELCVLDEGFACLRELIASGIPALIRPLAFRLLRRGMKHHLFERGIARHRPDEIELQGRTDIDALAAWLGDREWFITDWPTQADASAFGLLAVTIRSNLPTPVCRYARTKPNLVAFVDRALVHWFGDAADTCHNGSFAGTSRQWAMNWCNQANAKLHVGDFSGPSGIFSTGDFLCHHPSGFAQIAYQRL